MFIKMETEKIEKNEELQNSFVNFQQKNRKHIKEKYENNNFKLDSLITPFIMLLSSIILFFETFFITLIPLLSDNIIFSKLNILFFDWYLIAEELFLGSFYYISGSINESNYDLLKNKFSECNDKISHIFKKLSDICYLQNKDKIEKKLINISEGLVKDNEQKNSG